MDFKENLLQMEASRNRVRGGLWNMPGPRQYSKDTQDMLKLMMQESRLTHLQKRRITDCLQKGTALPLTFDPPLPAPPREPKTVQRCPSARPQRRSAEACRRGDAYVRERFCPGPTSRFPKLWPSCPSARKFKRSSLFLGDVEKEKRRLQNIMSTGQEEPAPVSSGRGPDPDTGGGDRFQEVLGEIEERRRFLADMASLGQGKKYINIINTEISQKIQELEMLEKRSSFQKDATESEERNDYRTNQ
ncbi:UPF0193 protein EVG1 isoform X1 [Takifugu flavidus]|uniref:UPF0193 protein EVG1 isoform X1 n=2 Tax=Takifugu flavidus TaxID=433684 RepID=UPI0025444851|nr:UPF0193 protein EVG1 isoform X1 [Takifugu flavidus]